MRILTRYILREFIIPLFYCLTGFISIYVLFELFGSFSRLTSSKLPLLSKIEYFAAYLAPYCQYLVPAAAMLATLYTMWTFCRHSEITAMRASGVSFMVIARPLLAVSLLLAAGVWWVSDVYMPMRAQWARELKTNKFNPDKISGTGNLVYPSGIANRVWSIERIEDVEAHHLANVQVTMTGERGVRESTISAERAEYLDGEWWFYKPEIQHYDNSGNNLEAGGETATATPELDSLTLRAFPEFRERPADFLAMVRPFELNSVRDKLRYIKSHPNLSATDHSSAVFDVWAMILAPFACLVITLFAIPAGIATGRQSAFRGILGALGMYFAFYALVIFGKVAANLMWLNPIVAAMMPYVIFLVIGSWMFWRQR